SARTAWWSRSWGLAGYAPRRRGHVVADAVEAALEISANPRRFLVPKKQPTVQKAPAHTIVKTEIVRSYRAANFLSIRAAMLFEKLSERCDQICEELFRKSRAGPVSLFGASRTGVAK